MGVMEHDGLLKMREISCYSKQNVGDGSLYLCTLFVLLKV